MRNCERVICETVCETRCDWHNICSLLKLRSGLNLARHRAVGNKTAATSVTINRTGPHRTAVFVLIHVMVISFPLRSGTVNSHTGCNGLITRSAWLVVVQRQLGGHMKFIEPYSITVTVTPTLTLKLTISLILTLT